MALPKSKIGNNGVGTGSGLDADDLPLPDNVSAIGKFDPNRQSTLASKGTEVGQLPVSELPKTNVISEVLDTAGEVTGAVTNTTLMAAGVLPMVTPLVESGAGLVGKAGEKIGVKFIENAGKNTQAGINRLTEKTFEEVMPNVTKSKFVIRPVNFVSNVAGNVINKITGVLGSKNQSIGNDVKALPQTIAKSNMREGLVNTAFIAGSAISMFGVATGFIQNLASLKEMHKDITGKSASTYDVLFGKVSVPVADARSKLLKTFTVSGTTDVISLGVAVAGAISKKVPMLAFFAPQVLSMGASTLIGESAMPYYASIKQAHAAGQKIPADAYAELIAKASPELAKRGGSASVFTQKLAEQYAQNNVSPAQIMREAANGQLIKRVDGIIAANEAAKKTTVNTALAAQPQQAHSHVAALEGKRNGQAVQGVVGEHTARIVSDAVRAGQTPNLVPAGV